ncbi:unnamed protein product [Schistosoma turkestanicum]|nr:unnamed protein product [Schistosoma turkestanicum]
MLHSLYIFISIVPIVISTLSSVDSVIAQLRGENTKLYELIACEKKRIVAYRGMDQAKDDQSQYTKEYCWSILDSLPTAADYLINPLMKKHMQVATLNYVYEK